MAILLYPAYLPNIWTMAAMLQSDEVIFEGHGNYQKQTYRNRAFIYGPNGRQALTIPVNFTQKIRQLYSEVRISSKTNWRLNQWKSLQSAYNTSAFFEFYKDRFELFFAKDYENIMDLSLESIRLILSCLDFQMEWTWTEVYEKHSCHTDLRFLINSRKEKSIAVEPYFQLFSEKHGFINNLSTIDLIFNEGPNALPYLMRQDFDQLSIQ